MTKDGDTPISKNELTDEVGEDMRKSMNQPYLDIPKDNAMKVFVGLLIGMIILIGFIYALDRRDSWKDDPKFLALTCEELQMFLEKCSWHQDFEGKQCWTEQTNDIAKYYNQKCLERRQNEDETGKKTK